MVSSLRCPDATLGPLPGGLGAGHDGKHLVAGPFPWGPAGLSPRRWRSTAQTPSSAYPPFLESLEGILESAPSRDSLLQSSHWQQQWDLEGRGWKEWLPDLNPSGLLLDFCAHHGLSVRYTMFRHKGVHNGLKYKVYNYNLKYLNFLLVHVIVHLFWLYFEMIIFQNLQALPVFFPVLCPQASLFRVSAHGAFMNLGLAASCSSTSFELPDVHPETVSLDRGIAVALISPKWHHFPGSGEWALLCTLFLALSNSVHVAFIILFSSWWFLAFSISEKKLCHNLFFFFSCLFVLCFASTGKSSGCFVIYIPFPASVCVPIALIFAPCVSPLTPAASACYFQHLSMLLLVSQTQNCIFKMLGLMLLVARVFRPKKHKGLSSFSATVSVNPAAGYVVSYFPCSCQTLLHFVVQTYLSPSMHRDVSLLQI